MSEEAKCNCEGHLKILDGKIDNQKERIDLLKGQIGKVEDGVDKDRNKISNLQVLLGIATVLVTVIGVSGGVIVYTAINKVASDTAVSSLRARLAEIEADSNEKAKITAQLQKDTKEILGNIAKGTLRTKVMPYKFEFGNRPAQVGGKPEVVANTFSGASPVFYIPPTGHSNDTLKDCAGENYEFGHEVVSVSYTILNDEHIKFQKMVPKFVMESQGRSNRVRVHSESVNGGGSFNAIVCVTYVPDTNELP